MGESGSEASHIITEPRNFAKVIRLAVDIRKSCPKATLKDIKKIINGQNFLMDDQEKRDPVTPRIYVYNTNIKSDGSLNKLKLKIVIRQDLQNT